jgi:glycosyltransferase involved in cell wall biosynthesis
MSTPTPDSRRATPPPVIAHGLFSYQIGGSERIGADLAIGMARRGYEVVCFAMYDSAGPFLDELQQAGVRTVDLDYTRRPRYLRRLSYQFEFLRFLQQYQVDSLIVHHATALVLCGLSARMARTRQVMMIEHAIHQLIERPNYRRQAKRYCGFADSIVGVDPKIVEYFASDMGVPQNRLHYVANGVSSRPANVLVRDRWRMELGCDGDTVLFMYVGRLQPVKDLGTLIAAVGMLPEATRRRVKVALVGDGAERSALEAQAQALNLSGVVLFLGARGDVQQLLSAADAFVMTSITEGQPMAMIEAMTAGLPCLGTDVGGIPALIGDGRGLVVPSRSAAQVAHAMVRLVSDPNLRAELGAAGQMHAERHHGLEACVSTYLGILGLPERLPLRASV